MAHISRFKAGDTEVSPRVRRQLPLKRNYNLAIHMHSLDWFGCDSSLGTIEAIMRRWRIDICGLALKDTACYDNHLDLDDYSNEKALFLHGQEYHPFNWHDSHDDSHNTYHILALGVDEEAYTPEFTCSLFSDAEVEDYFRRAIAMCTSITAWPLRPIRIVTHGLNIPAMALTWSHCAPWLERRLKSSGLQESILPL